MGTRPILLVATGDRVRLIDAAAGAEVGPEAGQNRFESRAACLAADPASPARAWCGTADGVWRTGDGGSSWRRVGLDGETVTAVAASPAAAGVVWAGTEPSALWRSADAGETWARARGLTALPSSDHWAFPPRPETHHVRWIGCHPGDPGRLWLAIEAGALVTTPDGGRSWRDRVPGGPIDTHQLALHPEAPDSLRSAAGDGFFESRDGGASWSSPEEGLEVLYLRSVAIDPGDPETTVVSAAPGPYSAYVAGRSAGRLYRRRGEGAWQRIAAGWPEPAATIAPLLAPGRSPGELWAADERGLHSSDDGGTTWEQVAAFEPPPRTVDALALLAVG